MILCTLASTRLCTWAAAGFGLLVRDGLGAGGRVEVTGFGRLGVELLGDSALSVDDPQPPAASTATTGPATSSQVRVRPMITRTACQSGGPDRQSALPSVAFGQ